MKRFILNLFLTGPTIQFIFLSAIRSLTLDYLCPNVYNEIGQFYQCKQKMTSFGAKVKSPKGRGRKLPPNLYSMHPESKQKWVSNIYLPKHWSVLALILIPTSLYYEHIMTIINDASRVFSEWCHNLECHSRVVKYDPRGIIKHSFIMLIVEVVSIDLEMFCSMG